MSWAEGKRILVLSRAVVGERMSSPGIRAANMARVLAEALPEAHITLGVPANSIGPPREEAYETALYRIRTLAGLVARNDVIISMGFPPHLVPLFMRKTLVLDFFSQFYVEWTELERGKGPSWTRRMRGNSNRSFIAEQLTFADFILCANERQRDSYLGALSALGLLDASVYERDRSLRSLIDVAPHGVRPEPPVHSGTRRLKGVHPAVRESDRVFVWNAGIVPWYDPVTLIRAIARIRERRDDVKLLFLGTRYPDAVWEENRALHNAFALARDLNLIDETVIFQDGWVPFEEVKDYILECYAGACTYRDTLETRYSFRTRFVDLVWAGLPIVCTAGDVLAERVDRETLGIVVPEGDVDAVEAALLRLLDDCAFYETCRANLACVREELTWERAFAPLVRFLHEGVSGAKPKRSRLGPLVARSAHYLADRSALTLIR
ncbi:MAG TPA: glycosyltransferase [Dehalococcoidia bacterium]|nr:glycosyltransferase [Dehalococcoidia bacterium]